MEIRIEWLDGRYPSFNVALASSPDKEPFITIKNCRIVSGSKGDFISWPAKKLDSGKYWNYVWASEPFAAAVLEKAQASKPSDKRSGSDDDMPPF